MATRTETRSVQSYRDLVVWQKALTLAEAVYGMTRKFPKEEVYGLTSQMRRAAVSVASNIAEGHARNTQGEFLQFLGHARGSLAELQTQATLASRLSFVQSEIDQQVNQQIAEVGRLLNALRTALSRRSQPSRGRSEP
jgi:four helix bundle protein